MVRVEYLKRIKWFGPYTFTVFQVQTHDFVWYQHRINWNVAFLAIRSCEYTLQNLMLVIKLIILPIELLFKFMVFLSHFFLYEYFYLPCIIKVICCQEYFKYNYFPGSFWNDIIFKEYSLRSCFNCSGNIYTFRLKKIFLSILVGKQIFVLKCTFYVIKMIK